MGLEAFEVVFMWMGKFIWRLVRFRQMRDTDLSDGTYEVIGFLSITILCIILFSLWGIVNV